MDGELWLPTRTAGDLCTCDEIEQHEAWFNSALASAQAALEALRAHPLGRDAAIIGRVTADQPCMVVMRTSFGTRV